MNAFQLTEQAKRDLHALLDGQYRPQRVAGLANAVRSAIHDIWEQVLPRFVCARGTDLFGASRTDIESSCVEIGGTRYRLRVTTAIGNIPRPHTTGLYDFASMLRLPAPRAPQKPGGLVARVNLPAPIQSLDPVPPATLGRPAILVWEPIGFGPDQNNMVHEAVRIRPLGGYDELILCYPDCIRLTDDQLQATKLLTSEIISVAYRWTENLIVEAIKENTKRLSLGLYSYVRNMLGEELSKGIVFSCLFQDQDFVILDDVAASGIFELASIAGGAYAMSPIATAAKLLGEVVSIKDSVIKDAAERSGSFEFSLVGSDATHYYRNEPALYDALRAVWGAGFSCTRILKNDKFIIVAFAPAKYSTEVLPRLEMYQKDLEERASTQLKNLRKHLDLVRELGLANILDSSAAAQTPHDRSQMVRSAARGVGNYVGNIGTEKLGAGIGAGLAAFVRGLFS